MKIGNVVMLKDSVPTELQEHHAGMEMTVYMIMDEIAGNSCEPVVGVRSNTMEGAGSHEFSYFYMRDLKVVK